MLIDGKELKILRSESEIQNRVKLAESRLPAEVVQNGISVEKQAPSQLMTLTLMSDDPKFDEIYLSNFATLNVERGSTHEQARTPGEGLGVADAII